MALREHLGADKDVDFAGADQAEGFRECAARGCSVAIHAGDDGAGHDFAQGFLDALRPLADRSKVGAAAIGAVSGRSLPVAAVVAAQLSRAKVEHQVRAAARAGRVPATVAAVQHRREAAAVDEDEALLASLQALAQRGRERVRDPILRTVGTRVDRANDGHRRARHSAFGKAPMRVAALLRVLVALE